MFPSIKTIKTDSQVSVFEYMFSDVNIQFSSQPDEFVYDIDAVIQAFLILLGTSKRERWWRPEYGTYNLERLLFEPFDITTADQIAESIKSISESASNGNIRLTIDGVSVRPDYATQTYEVNLRINVPNIGNKKVQFFLRQPE